MQITACKRMHTSTQPIRHLRCFKRHPSKRQVFGNEEIGILSAAQEIKARDRTEVHRLQRCYGPFHERGHLSVPL